MDRCLGPLARHEHLAQQLDDMIKTGALLRVAIQTLEHDLAQRTAIIRYRVIRYMIRTYLYFDIVYLYTAAGYT